MNSSSTVKFIIIYCTMHLGLKLSDEWDFLISITILGLISFSLSSISYECSTPQNRTWETLLKQQVTLKWVPKKSNIPGKKTTVAGIQYGTAQHHYMALLWGDLLPAWPGPLQHLDWNHLLGHSFPTENFSRTSVSTFWQMKLSFWSQRHVWKLKSSINLPLQLLALQMK